MWSGATAVEELPWKISEGRSVFSDEVFIQTPKAFGEIEEQNGDLFGRERRSGRHENLQSPESISSISHRLAWSSKEVVVPRGQVFEGIGLQLVVLMNAVQMLLKEMEFELIHPNDLEYIARHGDLIIRVMAEWESAQNINLTVLPIVGEGEEFDNITTKISERITTLLANSPA